MHIHDCSAVPLPPSFATDANLPLRAWERLRVGARRQPDSICLENIYDLAHNGICYCASTFHVRSPISAEEGTAAERGIAKVYAFDGTKICHVLTSTRTHRFAFRPKFDKFGNVTILHWRDELLNPNPIPFPEYYLMTGWWCYPLTCCPKGFRKMVRRQVEEMVAGADGMPFIPEELIASSEDYDLFHYWSDPLYSYPKYVRGSNGSVVLANKKAQTCKAYEIGNDPVLVGAIAADQLTFAVASRGSTKIHVLDIDE